LIWCVPRLVKAEDPNNRIVHTEKKSKLEKKIDDDSVINIDKTEDKTAVRYLALAFDDESSSFFFSGCAPFQWVVSKVQDPVPLK
jgi:hypothetical protein